MKQIVVTVQRDGTTSVDAQGFKGKGCHDATEAIEVAIGGAAASKDVKRKPDYFAQHSSNNTLKQR